MPDQRADNPSPPSPDDQAVVTLTKDPDSLERTERLIEQSASHEQISDCIKDVEPADAADLIENLESDDQSSVVHLMEDRAAADALAHMELPLAVSVLVDLETEEAARLLALMDPDDAADLIQQLKQTDAEDLLRRLHPRTAAKIGKLALYDPETAGGLMTTDIPVIRATQTIGQAIETLKRLGIRPEQPVVYCVDEHRALIGTISVATLLVEDDDKPLEAFIDTDVDAAPPEMDQEEVARLFERYDYLTLPVIDNHRRILGIITIDDVIDTISAEATEDAYKQVGAGTDEAVYSGVLAKLKGRFPWLALNLVTASLAASVLIPFQSLIERIAVAAAIFPIIANQAGNAGFQSLAITLRGLTLGEVRRERVRQLIVRELAFGILTGLGLGVFVFLGITALGILGNAADIQSLAGLGPKIGAVAASAMAISLIFACLIGAAIPLLLNKLGIDPATAASIFLITCTDTCAFLAFLGLLWLGQEWLLTTPPNPPSSPITTTP